MLPFWFVDIPLLFAVYCVLVAITAWLTLRRLRPRGANQPQRRQMRVVLLAGLFFAAVSLAVVVILAATGRPFFVVPSLAAPSDFVWCAILLVPLLIQVRNLLRELRATRRALA